MIYGYCRVSTRGQLDGHSIEDQRDRIKKEYPDAQIIEEAYSGAKERPKFMKMLEDCKDGDLVVATKLDRFSRSVTDGLRYIETLLNKGVKIHILNMGLIEDSPIGKLIRTNLLAFAEFERAMILERMQAGKEIARLSPDYVEGRPQKFSPAQLEHAYLLKQKDGYSYTVIEKMTGISKSTQIRYMNKKRAEAKRR